FKFSQGDEIIHPKPQGSLRSFVESLHNLFTHPSMSGNLMNKLLRMKIDFEFPRHDLPHLAAVSPILPGDRNHRALHDSQAGAQSSDGRDGVARLFFRKPFENL